MVSEPIWTRSNVVAITIAFLLFCFVLGSSYENYVREQSAAQNGIELAEANQNAVSGLNLVARELRAAGVGFDPSIRSSILVGSQYRITFAVDFNRNQRVDYGEIVTYFLDPSWREGPISPSTNPYGFVLRRVVSAAGDSLAAPTLGRGEIVAYGLSQRSRDTAATKNVPLFSYRDSLGAPLELGPGSANDAAGLFFGRTVSGADLGPGAAPARTSRVETIVIRLVAESKEKNRETGGYDRVVVSSTIRPGSAPLGETGSP